MASKERLLYLDFRKLYKVLIFSWGARWKGFLFNYLKEKSRDMKNKGKETKKSTQKACRIYWIDTKSYLIIFFLSHLHILKAFSASDFQTNNSKKYQHWKFYWVFWHWKYVLTELCLRCTWNSRYIVYLELILVNLSVHILNAGLVKCLIEVNYHRENSHPHQQIMKLRGLQFLIFWFRIGCTVRL